MGLFVAIFNAFAVGLVGLLLAFLPVYSRSSLLLGYTVSAEFRNSAAGRAIVRQFRNRMLLATLISVLAGTLPVLLWPTESMIALCLGITPFVLIALGTWVYVVERRKVVPHHTQPSTTRRAPLTTDRKAMIPGPRWLHVLPYLFVLGPMLWLGLHWAEIPARFASHFNAAGEVDGWSDKSWLTVFGPPLLILAVMGGVHALMLLGRVVRRLPDQPRRSRAINIILLEVLYLTGAIMGYIFLAPLYGKALLAGSAGMVAILSMGLLSIALPLVTLLLYFRHDPGSAEIGDRSDDRYWYAGLIYVNPADPALMVEKRVGIGYTVNFGHPRGRLIAVLLVLIILAGLALPLILAALGLN